MLTMLVKVARYMYLFFILLFILSGLYLYKRDTRTRGNQSMYALQTGVWVLLNLTSVSLWILWARENAALSTCLLSIVLYLAAAVLLFVEGRRICRSRNRLIWNCILMLLSIGITILWRMDPADAQRQTYWLFAGALLAAIVYVVVRRSFFWKIPAWLFFVGGAGLILLPFVFPLASGGSLNWVNIGGIHFQPSEFVKLTWAFYLAVLYSKEPKILSVGQAAASYALMAVVLLKQNDLGALLIFGIVLWFMTYLYTERSFILWGGAIGVCLAAVAAYFLVSHVRVRFDAWLDPWSDITGGGYQMAQSLFAIAAGGWFGTGLYLGESGYIPERSTDMIFASLTEEFGVLFMIILVAIYGLLFYAVWRGAEREKNGVRRNVLYAFSLLLGSQTLLIIGGNIGLLPLTGVTLPFISYGGSSMLASFIEIAVIVAVLGQQRGEEGRHGKKRKDKAAEPIGEYPFEEAD